MKRRWLEILAVLVVTAWLALFTMGCPPPPETSPMRSGSSAGQTSSKPEPPLEQPGAALEEQAGQGELAPSPQDVQPIQPEVHHAPPTP